MTLMMLFYGTFNKQNIFFIEIVDFYFITAFKMCVLVFCLRIQAIPFLLELRSVLDWVCTKTTLTLNHWLKMEDIYANVFIMKCWRDSEKVSIEYCDLYALFLLFLILKISSGKKTYIDSYKNEHFKDIHHSILLYTNMVDVGRYRENFPKENTSLHHPLNCIKTMVYK